MDSNSPPSPGDADPADSIATDDAAWLQQTRESTAELLNGLLSAHQIDRAELAKRLGWKPARVNRVLSGKENLSIHTIALITRAANVNFELGLRERTNTGDKAAMAASATPGANWGAFGVFVGMSVGVGLLGYVGLSYLAIDYLQPMTGALLVGTVFMLARAYWKLHLVQRELRALKRYRKQQEAAPRESQPP